MNTDLYPCEICGATTGPATYLFPGDEDPATDLVEATKVCDDARACSYRLADKKEKR